jgi:glycopeptide antibiotics resistance protein
LSRTAPLYAAVAIFPLIAAGAALPYVALQYRRHGSLGAGQLALAAIFGLYLVGLAFAVVLPLRPVTADFCQIFGVEARLNPLFILDEARSERAVGGWSAVLRNADVQDVFLNFALFVPFGMFVRYLLGRGFFATVAIGAAATLLIELTQLTGDWGLYPCAYRYFSTSDLIANTLGAGLGAVLAPVLRLVPWQSRPRAESELRKVTPGRRYLAALSNVALIAFAGFALLALSGLILDATRGQLFISDSVRSQALRAIALVLVPGVTAFLLIPLAWAGRTPGEWAVLLRPAGSGAGAGAPAPLAIATRFALVQGPMLAAAAAGVAGFEPAWIALAILAAVQALLVATAKERRGGAELRLGIAVVDTRWRRPRD